MNMKSDTAEFDTEIVGLNKRQLTARVLTMEQEQAKREQLLGDPARLAEYAVDKGLPVSEMRELLQANHRNNAPRLARYKEVLAIKPDARRVQFGWTELPPDAVFPPSVGDQHQSPGVANRNQSADTSHLVALHERLLRERARLATAGSEEERAVWQVWVAQAERELEGELKFLGMDGGTEVAEISDDDVLAELGK